MYASRSMPNEINAMTEFQRVLSTRQACRMQIHFLHNICVYQEWMGRVSEKQVLQDADCPHLSSRAASVPRSGRRVLSKSVHSRVCVCGKHM